MNYLAHSFLSNKQSGLLVGNFIADHLHGNRFENLPDNIIEGIKLHRKIDAFTDSHIKFRESKRLFYNRFEKYSGILVDIYFDHLLAKNYARYSSIPLQDHCEFVYRIYQEHIDILPESGAGFLNYVLKNNVFYNYSSVKGIEKVLFHLSRRIGHNILLNESLADFTGNKARLEENFGLFFNDAIKEFIN